MSLTAPIVIGQSHMYIPCNLNRVKIFAQYYVNRVSAVSSPNSVILVFVLQVL